MILMMGSYGRYPFFLLDCLLIGLHERSMVRTE
jgi:hypothetical protein